MADEAKIRVRIDTSQAKSELRGLTKEGAKTAGRVGQTLRGIVGRGVGALGIGAGIGAGMAAFRGQAQGSISALAEQTLGPSQAWFSRLIFGKYGPEAIGRQRASEEVIRMYGPLAGLTGKIPAGAPGLHQHLSNLYTREAEGIDMMRRSTMFSNDIAREIETRNWYRGLQTLTGWADDARKATAEFFQWLRSQGSKGR